ncbi:MAG: acetate--CoA ligase family protein [Candidatus Moranbacteria bacterium]|nr:acetate--CoA ligase family protein [Candidatus Moranbacteria bacterium]
MQKLLEPKSIAVIGASNKKGKIGNILLKNIKNSQYKGKVYPVNPKHYKVEGIKAYPSVSDIEDDIDTAVVALPAELVVQVVEECAWRESPIQNIIIISAGFSEIGDEGKEREDELVQLAKEYDLNILGPNCLGFINTEKDLNASFASQGTPKGGTAIVSQSGAFVTALMDMALDENLGFSKVITIGNKTVLNEGDFIDYLAQDKQTKAVGFYLESISDGRDFRNKLLALSKRKPVLILKAGNSKKVKKAIQSHTGSMAGELDAARAAFEEGGALLSENIASFWGAIKVFNELSRGRQMKNNEGVIVTNAGGPGVITTDLIEKSASLSLYDLPEKAKEDLSKNLPAEASVENPIDLLGDADPSRYDKTLKQLNKNSSPGFVIALITPQAQTDIKGIMDVLEKNKNKLHYPVFPVIMSSVQNRGGKKGSWEFPSRLLGALEEKFKYDKISQTSGKVKKPQKASQSEKAKQATVIYKKASAKKRKVFYYNEALDTAKIYEINGQPAYEINTKYKLDNLKVNHQGILKIDDPGVIHKTAQGGVVSGVENKNQLKKAGRKLWKKFPGSKLILQKQIKPGKEFIIGIKKDPAFGPLLMCGLGGVLTEIFDEKIIWVLPAEKTEIKEKIKDSVIFEIIKKEGLDIQELTDLAYKAGNLGWENPWVEELDINPVFLYQDRPAVAVDIKVKIDS